MPFLELKDLIVIDLQPPKLPPNSEEITVRAEQRLPIRFQYAISASDASRKIVKWLERNLVVRNNFPLARLDIIAIGDEVLFHLVELVFDRADHVNPDREDGRFEVVFEQHMHAQYVEGKHGFDALLHRIRSIFREFMLHELDECIVIGGTLPFNPHRDP